MSRSLNKTLSYFVALSFVFAQSVHAADDLSQQLSKTEALLNNGKARAALGTLRSLVGSHPENAQAHMQLGAALASLADGDDYEAAISEEQTALKLDPKSYGARKILGHIYANLHKPQESIKMLEEACEINPKSYGTQRDLGTAQMAAGHDDEAIEAFKKAVVLNPSKVDSHQKLATLLSKKDDFKAALAEAHKGVQLDLSNPESHLVLGNVLLAAGNKAEAAESYEAAMQANQPKGYRNPLTEASALSGLGWAYAAKNAEKKNLDEAIADQRKAIKIFPSFGPAYVRLAELLSMEGNNKDAELVYKSSLKMSGDDSSVAIAYAKFLGKIGRSDESRGMLKKILEKTPDSKAAANAMSELDPKKTN